MSELLSLVFVFMVCILAMLSLRDADIQIKALQKQLESRENCRMPQYVQLGEGVVISQDMKEFLYMEKYHCQGFEVKNEVARICHDVGQNCVGLSLLNTAPNDFVLVYQDETKAKFNATDKNCKVTWVPDPKSTCMNGDFHSKQPPNTRVASVAAYKGWGNWHAYLKKT